jgi:hypothetical protein
MHAFSFSLSTRWFQLLYGWTKLNRIPLSRQASKNKRVQRREVCEREFGIIPGVWSTNLKPRSIPRAVQTQLLDRACSSKSQRANGTMGDDDLPRSLPDDVVQDEVLRRLPPVALAVCRCVFKAWCDAIDSGRMLRSDLLPLGIFVNVDHVPARRRRRCCSRRPRWGARSRPSSRAS